MRSSRRHTLGDITVGRYRRDAAVMLLVLVLALAVAPAWTASAQAPQLPSSSGGTSSSAGTEPTPTPTPTPQPPPPGWVDDPLAPQQRHLHPVSAYQAWTTHRGEGAVVAVLDTGVDLDHPDLQARLLPGVDLVDRDTPPDDPQGHGTIVAGIIAAIAGNDRGVVGVAPRTMIQPVRVLDADGGGQAAVVAEGIRWATAAQVDVINLSLAEVRSSSTLANLPLVANSDVRDAIAEAANAGIVVVAAAGNEGRTVTPYQDDAPVLVVGAVTEDDQRWPESNHDQRTLFAPGVDILSTWHEARYARSDGTSFATPIVAAGAAMLAASGMDGAAIRARLAETADDIGVGAGRINLAAAVAGLQPDPTPEPTPEPPPPPPPSTPAPPPPADPPPDGQGSGDGFGTVEVVEEVTPPTQQAEPGPQPTPTAIIITEPPPPPPTEPVSGQGQLEPGAQVAVRPSVRPSGPSPDPAPGPDGGIAVQQDPGDGRGLALGVATALLGVDVALAGWLLGARDPAGRRRGRR